MFAERSNVRVVRRDGEKVTEWPKCCASCQPESDDERHELSASSRGEATVA